MGISCDEYALLDCLYKTQTSPIYGKDGWCEHSYAALADVVGIGKGGIFQMVDRLTKKGLIEVNPANPKHKKATPEFFLYAYHDVQEDKELGAIIVQKVNAEQSFVQKVNGKRSESERNRSESERQINVIKKEENNSLSISVNEKIEDASERRSSESIQKLTDYFVANPARWEELCDEARVKMSKADFWDNVKKWVRWNADNYQVHQSPVKALTSGRNNFLSWLGNERTRQAADKAKRPAYADQPQPSPNALRIHRKTKVS
jgi:hypothetical protein